ncbi:hypothetical protein GPX89_08330 [Nocardia sp. ET3-3]|uniref:Uncharacterized protein n=1 Tax=Nocardia terrae TaxID=2675851 RepID=A0A7K1USJ0_9NOCA|nr:hypothetical protein [Nocardia terrae]MVU77251.1 hypothetical protein [Nocardia terrae]
MTSTHPPQATRHPSPHVTARRIPTDATDPDDPSVVYWPEPSPLRPWWDTIMQPAMRADPVAPRSPDPRHPRARSPYPRRTRSAARATTAH